MKKKGENSPVSYKAASEELETIVQALQSDAIDVDTLTEQVKRAKVLIEYCQSRLRATEEEVNALFSTEE